LYIQFQNMIHPTNNKILSGKIIWHLKVVAGAVFISLIFGLVLQQKLFSKQLPGMLILTFAQLEIFIWLGTRFFQSIKSDAPNFSRKIITRLLLFYFTVLVIAFTMFLVMYTYHFIKNGAEFSMYFKSLAELELKRFFIATLVGFAFGAIFFFYSQWNEALKNMQKLKEEKLIFQYETLKSQVNPHFLFNSLNTLSSLVRENTNLSEEFIQKLSHIYRYILENEKNELVPLHKEIEFVRDYFYLQKIRDEEKISLKIELAQMEEALILPVSLQLLVENALKHNVATRNQPLEITIHKEGIDKLVVRNTLKRKLQLNASSGIGLKNLNERCRLILNRVIEIQETADEYIVKVPVKIDLK
jgi:two-component system, LytTR family, sensor kinase